MNPVRSLAITGQCSSPVGDGRPTFPPRHDPLSLGTKCNETRYWARALSRISQIDQFDGANDEIDRNLTGLLLLLTILTAMEHSVK
jgi:hypothetical protein